MMSNFSFSHSVFKRLVLQTRKNRGLFGKQRERERESNIVKKDTFFNFLCIEITVLLFYLLKIKSLLSLLLLLIYNGGQFNHFLHIYSF